MKHTPLYEAMPEWEQDMLRAFAADLLTATAGCRPDMHEPDEQGVSAHVTGHRFDNAGTYGEILLHINREGDTRISAVNVATLVALARIGAQHIAKAGGSQP